MMKLKPNCECCDKDLPPESGEAVICTFECTFCATCADTVFGGACPNCGGNFVSRPVHLLPCFVSIHRPPKHLREQPCLKAG